jgi:hypothetical protein
MYPASRAHRVGKPSSYDQCGPTDALFLRELQRAQPDVHYCIAAGRVFAATGRLATAKIIGGHAWAEERDPQYPDVVVGTFDVTLDQGGPKIGATLPKCVVATDGDLCRLGIAYAASAFYDSPEAMVAFMVQFQPDFARRYGILCQAYDDARETNSG